MQHCSKLLGELVSGGRPCLDLLTSNGDLMDLPPQNEIDQAGKAQRDVDEAAQVVKDETRAADDQAGHHGVQDEVARPETLQQLEFERLEADGCAHRQTQPKTEPARWPADGGKLGEKEMS